MFDVFQTRSQAQGKPLKKPGEEEEARAACGGRW